MYESPYEKAMEANKAGVNFFVSIHRNSYPTANAVSGVESLVYDKSGIKYEMAQNINEQLESIGFVNLGVKARPNLIVLRSSGGTVPGSGGTAGGAGGRYRVQVGAFRNQVYANNLLRELQEQEYPARIEDSNGFYRVVVGSYPTLQEAAQMEQRLKWAGYPTIVIH